ncbi:alpha/beta fold hydrolase [Reyranella sp.]|uniref:YheT family hydrolase n=1 Tax=Reyranella sp. TaxID=1929291 RepID=UPI0025D1C0F2|nr:alpha/beta fold hydrolase [Reyranella sp.]
MKLDLPLFRPRFPWWGADLQTVANFVRPLPKDLAPHTSERLIVDLGDGTGDRLACTLDRPSVPAKGKPLTILVHGLTGSQESSYILSLARCLLDAGERVLRVNLRGAGPSRATCGGQYYAGRSQDLRALLANLPADLKADGVRIVGYSLGAATLLKYLGEEGEAASLLAAAAICAPIDLSATCRRMLERRNFIYHRHLLGMMKIEATATGAQLQESERAAILGSRTIWEYDEVFIAPRHGFAGAEDYYERCKPVRFMAGIRVPTLVLAALDDPWIPGALYSSYQWTGNKALMPLLPLHGGHVGFHGSGSLIPWCDQAVAKFFEVTSA